MEDSKNARKFDWAKAIYELAINQSSTVNEIIESAGLDPEGGDVADLDLSDLDLTEQDLCGWDLSSANLTNTLLTRTNLKKAKINAENLIRAKDWRKAYIDDDLRRQASILEEVSTLLLKRVDELELSIRSAHLLKNDNIIYIGDLIQKTEAEMLRVPNFGRRSLNEIKEVLAGMGVHLGMEVPNWPPENIEELAKRFENQG
jgi:hypothetical protein